MDRHPDTDNTSGTALTPAEIARYSRHLSLPEVGPEGQRRLRDAAVLLIGAGGLGAPLGLYLAAAGIGRLGIVDHDRVELSNLQRQVLYDSSSVGQPKVACAQARIEALNPHVHVDSYATRFSASNAAQLIDNYDVIIDGTDNFPTRYLVNDACVLAGKPNVYGSIFRFEGQVSLFTSRGPCYRCLFPEPPAAGAVPNCAEGGVLGILPGIIGCLQATEAIKWILGKGAPLVGRLLLFDALEMRFREMSLRKDPDCPVCGTQPSIRELREEVLPCSAPATQTPDRIDPHELRRRLEAATPPVVVDVRMPHEWQIGHIPGALLIPLSELQQRVDELDPQAATVVYCHHGVRSLHALRLLHERGFAHACDLEGGVDAWSVEVDPSVPRY